MTKDVMNAHRDWERWRMFFISDCEDKGFFPICVDPEYYAELGYTEEHKCLNRLANTLTSLSKPNDFDAAVYCEEPDGTFTFHASASVSLAERFNYVIVTEATNVNSETNCLLVMLAKLAARGLIHVRNQEQLARMYVTQEELDKISTGPRLVRECFTTDLTQARAQNLYGIDVTGTTPNAALKQRMKQEAMLRWGASEASQ